MPANISAKSQLDLSKASFHHLQEVLLIPLSDLAKSGFEKALGYGAWKGLNVIAIGPKGGKIVGYDSKHKPIYAGSAGAEKLIQQKAAAAKAQAVAHLIADWLSDLGISGTFSGSGDFIVSDAAASQIESAFGVKSNHTSHGGSKRWFSFESLKPHIGEPLKPKPEEQPIYAARAASGELEIDMHEFPKDLSVLKDTGKTVGSHHGKIFIDPKTNKRYLFKAQDSAISRAEEAASRIARLILGPGKVQSTKYVKLDGDDGILIEMFGSSKEMSPEHGKPSEAVMQKYFDDIIQHHILDWVISNHDAHGGNFIIDKDGLKGIDKGQAFKAFVKNLAEVLPKPGLFHSKIANPNPSQQIYSYFWEAVHSGQLKGDPIAATSKVFSEMAKISTDQIRAIVTPYIKTAEKQFGIDADGLEQKIVGRFHDAKGQWEEFLGKILGKNVTIPIQGDDNFETMPASTEPDVPKFAIPLEPKPLAETKVPTAQKVAGWPQTQGKVTVYHPGAGWSGKPPSGFSGYPGPGYIAETKYKGSKFVFLFSDMKPGIVHVTFPDGSVADFDSPNKASDAVLLWSKGWDIHMSAVEKKQKKIGYPAKALLNLKAFNFEESGVPKQEDPIPANTPEEKKSLTLQEQLSQHWDGVISEMSVFPLELQEFLKANQKQKSPANWKGTHLPLGIVLKSGSELTTTAIGPDGNAIYHTWKIYPGGIEKILSAEPSPVIKVWVKYFSASAPKHWFLAPKQDPVGPAPKAVAASGVKPAPTVEEPKVKPALSSTPLVAGSKVVVSKKHTTGKQIEIHLEATEEGKFKISIPEFSNSQIFPTISSAAKWAWVNTKGYGTVAEYEKETGKKAPGVNWPFFGLKSQTEMPAAQAPAPEKVEEPTPKAALSDPNWETMPAKQDINFWIHLPDNTVIKVDHAVGPITITKNPEGGYLLDHPAEGEPKSVPASTAQLYASDATSGTMLVQKPPVSNESQPTPATAEEVPAVIEPTQEAPSVPHSPQQIYSADLFPSKESMPESTHALLQKVSASVDLWCNVKTPDGLHTVGDKAPGWPSWVPPPGVLVKGQFEGKDVWFTVSMSGYNTEGYTDDMVQFLVFDAQGKNSGLDSSMLTSKDPLEALDAAFAAYKKEKGPPSAAEVWSELFSQNVVFAPGANAKNYKELAPFIAEVITKTPEAMTEAEKNTQVVSDLAFEDAFKHLPEVQGINIHLGKSNKEGHHNISIYDMSSKKAVVHLKKMMLAYGLKPAFSTHPKEGKDGAFLTLSSDQLKKLVSIALPASAVPSVDVVSGPSIPSDNNFQTMPAWEGKKHVTVADLNALPVGTKIWNNYAPASKALTVKLVSGQWKDAAGVWDSEQLAGILYSIAQQQAEITELEPVPVGNYPKKIPKSWTNYKKRDALKNLPKDTILVTPTGRQYQKIHGDEDPSGLTEWQWVNAPPGAWSKDITKSRFAMAQVIEYVGGVQVQLPNASSPIWKTLAEAPAPKPAAYVPKPQDPEVALKKAWAKENKPIASEHAKRLAYLVQDLGLTEPIYARQGSTPETIIIGDGTTDFGAKLASLGLPNQQVDTPFGTLYRISEHGLRKATPKADTIKGPDGVTYPVGTTFEESEITKQISETVKQLSGFTKIAPYKSKETGQEIPGQVVIKLSGVADEQIAQAKTMIAQLQMWGVDAPAPPWKGGSYTMFGPIPEAELKKSIKVGVSVQPKIPPIPEPLKVKGLGISVGIQNEGEIAQSNRFDLADPSSIVPGMYGASIRFGAGGVLMDGQLRMHRIRMPDGQVVHRFVGELTRDTPKLNDDIKFEFGFSHTDESDPILDMYMGGKFKKMDFDAETGTWGWRADSGNPYKHGTDGSSGALLPQGAKLFVFKADATMPRTFCVDVPASSDAEGALATAMEKLGVDVEQAMAEPDEQDERILKKMQLLRSAIGNTGFRQIAAMNLLGKSKDERESFLDERLKGKIAKQTIDAARIVIGADGYHLVEATDVDKIIEANGVKGLVHGASVEGIIRAIAIQKGYGGQAKALFTGNTRDINSSFTAENAPPGQTSSGASDIEKGGGYGRFFRLVSDSVNYVSSVGSTKAKLVLHPRVLRRTNWYAFDGDGFGTQFERSDSRNRLTLGSIHNSSNEVCLEDFSPRDVIGIIVDDTTEKSQALAALKALGYSDWNGAPLDKFVQLASSVSGQLNVTINAFPGSKEPL